MCGPHWQLRLWTAANRKNMYVCTFNTWTAANQKMTVGDWHTLLIVSRSALARVLGVLSWVSQENTQQ